MGLLSEGSPLSWEETKKNADHVRKHGVIQFIEQYKKLKERQGDCLKWGDEVEYMLVRLDEAEKKATLDLQAEKVLPDLQEAEKLNAGDVRTLWRPEYASYMVEGTPGKPYGVDLVCFNTVEANMRRRREEVKKLLLKYTPPGLTVLPMSLTVFPRTGCPDFTTPSYQPTPDEGASHSLFFPDKAIFQGHPRFRTLTRNIRERRGEKPAINIPVYRDTKTANPYVEDLSRDKTGESQRAAKPDHVYLDCMGFGMGCSCVQTTFQAVNITEARALYDQLIPLCPIMLALSAASPIHRGMLVDRDCRWDIISGAVDCRTKEERGMEPLKKERSVIPKSRYDSVSTYISPAGKDYNDIDLVMDQGIFDLCKENGLDELLCRHIAHLFIRDPVSLFSEKIDQNDQEDTDHFENINSTNWQTMRFKLPPPNSTIGWRVEFRPCECQLTDFENAALVCFVVLLTRVILTYGLNFLMPISMVDENMKRAQKRGAVLNQKFLFRQDPTEGSSCCDPSLSCSPRTQSCMEMANGGQDCPCDVNELSIDEIVNGKEGVYPGLIPLIYMYLDAIETDVDSRCTISQYLSLIGKRASGELQTTATWMREFVQGHPEYKQDSVVSQTIGYDLLKACADISEGKSQPSSLLPKTDSKTTEAFSQAASTNG